ncbi:MAG: right-handed parallel beta-helix repeat-containing protein [Armatimonadota bacterium]|jgi:hypothetical protein
MNRRHLLIPLGLGLGAVFAVLALLGGQHAPVTAAPGAEWRVCAAGPPGCDYATVQGAVDGAQEGDVIKVAQGVYIDVHQRSGMTQVVILTKGVTLRGGYTTADGFLDPPDPEGHPTTLDAQQQGRVVVIDRAGPTVEGFTITGGAGYYSGGGVRMDDASGVVLRHNRIVGNSAEGDGGAIFVNSASGQIVGNEVVDNTATWGAGLRIINDADVAVVGNEIGDNVAQIAAGGIDVACCGGSTPLISQNVIVSNDGGGDGGGIRVQSTNARLVNNVVAVNQAVRGAGIMLSGSAGYPVSVTLVHNTLVGQGADDEGVRAEAYVVASLVNNIVADYATGITNTAPASSTVSADHTLFDGNGADYGGGVSCTNQITGPPAFVSPATGDYHITAASAAIDAGADAGVSVDVDNQPRSDIPDAGADEYRPPSYVYLPLVLRH